MRTVVQTKRMVPSLECDKAWWQSLLASSRHLKVIGISQVNVIGDPSKVYLLVSLQYSSTSKGYDTGGGSYGTRLVLYYDTYL